ncbi:MAG TPA: hypothetical protein VFY23_04775 [Candidatus Limnocylindrales bacterium]|nr:hypothetical protein [Candidatus Limnocylindrales bacterium]
MSGTVGAPSAAGAISEDVALLRRFEPILRFTHGELFFPMPATTYLGSCDLLGGSSLHDWTVLVEAGELTEDRLVEAGDAPPGQLRFLRFVQEPLNPIELARFNSRPGRPVFSAPGRLARVGLLARILDAALVASLLVRGKVPGGTAAAAALKYDGLRARDPRVAYHGRVVRKSGWVVLQYLFFYAMNDWRSTFEGANDHEADWEQAFVILEELPDGGLEPIWFAAAAHDEEGSDLRRRWDDPRLERQGEHVVVYPGAGSHATYMERGEYIMRLALPGERLVHGVLDLVRRTWRDSLNQPDPGDLAEALKRVVSVPFVDYARGDGLSVGPDQEVPWTPILVSDDDPWVDGYRGLWGLDTGDRLAGERAPAGPKYTRTGTVRQAWNDPLGFVGLTGLPTPAETRQVMADRVVELERERAAINDEAEQLAAELPKRGIEVRALAEEQGVDAYRVRRATELREGEAKLAALRAQSAELRAAIHAARDYIARYDAGWRGDPRSHLAHAAEPEPPDRTRRRVFAETWAALSVGVLVIALAVILWFRLLPIAPTVALLVVGYLAIESFAQRRVESLLLRLTVGLAMVSSVLLAYHFLRELVLLGLLALGLFILADNAGELARQRLRKRGEDHPEATPDGQPAVPAEERYVEAEARYLPPARYDDPDARPAPESWSQAAPVRQYPPAPAPAPADEPVPKPELLPEPGVTETLRAPEAPSWASEPVLEPEPVIVDDQPEPRPAPVEGDAPAGTLPDDAPRPEPAPGPWDPDEEIDPILGRPPAPPPPEDWDPLARRRPRFDDHGPDDRS